MLLKHQLYSSVAFRPLFAQPGGEVGAGTGGSPAGDPPENQDGQAGATGAADDTSGAADDNSEGQDGGSGEGGAPPAGGAAPSEDWRDREIKRKHAQLQDAKRREQEKDAELTALREIASRVNGGAAAEGDDPPARTTPAAPRTQDEVEEAAQRLVAKRNFDTAANEADAAGKKTYGADWDKVTGTLSTLGGFDPGSMQMILASDNPAQVIHAMGANPDKYHEIMGLPEAKRNAEIIKLGLAPAPKKKEISSAAAPVDTVGNRNRRDPTELRDDLTDDEWYARRQQQKAARFAAKSGRNA